MNGSVYIPLRDIARVCVLTEHTLITRYWPDHWAVPRDFRLIRSSVIVNEASLPDLVKELAESGQQGTAAVLQTWLDENAAEARLEEFIATRSPSRVGTAPAAPRPWFREGQYE